MPPHDPKGMIDLRVEMAKRFADLCFCFRDTGRLLWVTRLKEENGRAVLLEGSRTSDADWMGGTMHIYSRFLTDKELRALERKHRKKAPFSICTGCDAPPTNMAARGKKARRA